MTFQTWSYAAGDGSISFAHGWKRCDFPDGWHSWEAAQDALAHETMQTRATWWAKPAVVTTPATAYAVMGVARDASDAEIRARWRVLVKEIHPDRAKGSRFQAAERFHQVQQAWEAIGSPPARAAYDATLTSKSILPKTIGRPGWWNDGAAGLQRF